MNDDGIGLQSCKSKQLTCIEFGGEQLILEVEAWIRTQLEPDLLQDAPKAETRSFVSECQHIGVTASTIEHKHT